MSNLLSLITFLPLVGALVLVLVLRGDDAAAQLNAKMVALLTSSATFLLSLVVMFGFDPSATLP